MKYGYLTETKNQLMGRYMIYVQKDFFLHVQNNFKAIKNNNNKNNQKKPTIALRMS